MFSWVDSFDFELVLHAGYCNPAPTGAWDRDVEGLNMGEWLGIELAQGVPRNSAPRVSSAAVVGGPDSSVDKMLKELRVGGQMWVNVTSTRPGTRVLARWPAGLGLDSPSPSDFISVREPPSPPSGGGAAAAEEGRKGRVILLNLYPPSKDAGNASGAITTLWDPANTDMAGAMGTAVLLAAQTDPVALVNPEEEDDEDYDDVVEAIVNVINDRGVPLWNSGDYAGCARAYHRVATRFASTEPILAEALAACEGQPLDSSSNSQGWILRRALDTVCDQAREQASLVAREQRAAGTPRPPQ